MSSVLVTVLAVCGVFFTLLGLFVVVKTLVLPMREPADTSNRLGHLRLVWFALNSPERFVNCEPWLTRDEGDIVDD